MEIMLEGHLATEAIKDHVRTRFSRLEHHIDEPAHARVVLAVEALEQRASATLTVNGSEIHATASAPDLYAAIDTVASRLDRQLRDRHERRVDGRRRAGRHHESTLS